MATAKQAPKMASVSKSAPVKMPVYAATKSGTKAGFMASRPAAFAKGKNC